MVNGVPDEPLQVCRGFVVLFLKRRVSGLKFRVGNRKVERGAFFKGMPEIGVGIGPLLNVEGGNS
jgi:hypothetical protein